MENKRVLEAFTPTRIAVLFLLSLFGTGSAQADFSTGFETSSGYTSGASVLGVHDSAAEEGNTWTSLFGTASQMTTSDANPADGDLALTVVAPGDAAQMAYLDLGSSAPTSDKFNVKFDLAISSDVSVDTGNQVQIYFGAENGSSYLSDATTPFWFSVIYNDGQLLLSTRSESGTVFKTSIGDYTTFSDLGEYITFDITIDPSFNKYTSVSLSGTTSSADVTSTILAQNEGTIASKGGTPENIFSVVTGSNDTGTVYIDNLSVTSIPEPSALALFLGLSASAILYVRRHCA
jgi:hypothetical protein